MYKELAKLRIVFDIDEEWKVPECVLAATDSTRITGRAALEAARRAGWASSV